MVIDTFMSSSECVPSSREVLFRSLEINQNQLIEQQNNDIFTSFLTNVIFIYFFFFQ